jgi:hypothetical protein
MVMTAWLPNSICDVHHARKMESLVTRKHSVVHLADTESCLFLQAVALVQLTYS